MTTTSPFPRGPGPSDTWNPDWPVALREFGSDADDLALDFGSGARVQLVSDLLSRCAIGLEGARPTEAAIWTLPVSVRIRAILALAAMANPRPFEWRVKCGYPDCGADGELAISVDELEEFAPQLPDGGKVPIEIGEKTAWMRLPTGEDQRSWLSLLAGPEASQDPSASIIAQLLADPDDSLPLGAIQDSIDAAMERYDPLVAFSVDVACLACGRSTVHEVDLTEAALQRLWNVQVGRIEEIHRLASAYHWSEAEILSLPASRRQIYLAYIERSSL